MNDVNIDIIVVNYRTYPLVQKFIDSYYKFKPSVESRLIVVDNESDDVQSIKVEPEALVLSEMENLGYAKACNLGASLGNSKYIALMNSDVEFVDDGCIDFCVEFLEDHPFVGVVGPRQYSRTPNGRRITHGGIVGPGNKPAMRGWQEVDTGQYVDNQEVLMVAGSAMIIRREAWDAIHEDEVFKKHWPDALGAMPEHELYYEDTAICYAMPYFGYDVYYLGQVELVHEWHKTIERYPNESVFGESREKFRALMDDWGIIHD